ncbi:recombinase family protein [Brevundimonas sp. BT-123]|uniref:recombinase family protein n=1 Tax=Brevundimonas sp. BT-123 TaxID=2986928 RepID=UPI003556C1C5
MERRSVRAPPLEAPIRAEAYTLFASVRDLAEVATSLNIRGRRLRRKKRFTPADVKLMIQDPVSMGLNRGNCKRHHNVDARAAVSSVSVHQIESKELWTECNNVIECNSNIRD